MKRNILLILISIQYHEKLNAFILEIERYFNNIEEHRIWYKYTWGTLLWMAYIDYDDEAAKLIDDELEFLIGQVVVALEYEQQVFEGEISLEEVPNSLRYQVDRFAESRGDDGLLDFDFS